MSRGGANRWKVKEKERRRKVREMGLGVTERARFAMQVYMWGGRFGTKEEQDDWWMAIEADRARAEARAIEDQMARARLLEGAAEGPDGGRRDPPAD